MALKLITPPNEEPVDLTAAKLHLRVEHDDEDTLIQAQITAARRWAEAFLNRQLVTATWELVLDAFPRVPFQLPLPPLRSVDQVAYTDAAGLEATVPAEDYLVDTASEPGRLALTDGVTWPLVTLAPIAGVRVRFSAGYGTAADVPEDIRRAILLLVGQLYEHRQLEVTGIVVARLGFAAESLLWPYRVF